MPPKRRVVKTVRAVRKTPLSKTEAPPAADAASPETLAAPPADPPSPESAAVAEAAGDATPPHVAPTTEPSPPETTPQAASPDAAASETAPEITDDAAGAAAADAAGMADAAPGSAVTEPAESPDGATELSEPAARRSGRKVTTKVRKVTRRVPVRRTRLAAGTENEERAGDGDERQAAVPTGIAEQEGNPNGAVCSEADTGNEDKGGDGEESLGTRSMEMESTKQEGSPSGAVCAEAAKENQERGGDGEGSQETRPMETEQEGNPSTVVCSEAAVSISDEQIKLVSIPDQPPELEKPTSEVEAAVSTDGAAPAVVSKKRVRKVTIKRIVKKPKVSQKEEKKGEAEAGTVTGKPNSLDSDVNPDEPSKTTEPGVEVEAPTPSNGALQVPMQEDAIPDSGEHDSRSGGTGESVEAEEGRGEDAGTGGGNPDDLVEGVTERQKRRKTEIFVGGLDRSATEEDIRIVFGKVGEIVEVRLMMDGKTGKNKGYAFLRYATATQAKQAVNEFAKVEVCGKQCGAAALEGNDTIFLGNIDKKWKKDDVIKLLNEIGIEKIDTVTIMPDPNNADCNRGFAFLELETNRDAQIAFKKLQKKDVFGKGRNVKVAWAEPLNDPDEEEMQKVKSVYVEGIPSSWDEKKLRECFKKFGQIERVVLSRNMHSAKRKDFAFINFTTREFALSCIESFDKEDLSNNGSKVNLKVSLAKPVAKGKQNKAVSKSGKKDSSNEKPQAVQRETKVTVSNKSQPFKGPHGAVGGVNTSTTRELLHVLREQASWKQGQPGYSIGTANPGYMLVSHDAKRPFSALGDDSYSDTRGYPRARMDSAYPVASTSYSSLSHMSNASLPHYQQQNVRYGTGSIFGSADTSRTFQMRPGSAPRGSNLYSR